MMIDDDDDDDQVMCRVGAAVECNGAVPAKDDRL